MSDAPDLSEFELPARTNEPYDAPSALALIEAVRSYLQNDLLERLDGADRWTVRIAANALAIAGREVELGPDHTAAAAARYAALGASDDAELSAHVRAGDHDGDLESVRRAVLATVIDKLTVANPRYLDEIDRPRVG